MLHIYFLSEALYSDGSFYCNSLLDELHTLQLVQNTAAKASLLTRLL